MVGSRRLVIGDIHGCFVELEELLDRAGLSIGDEIIALGDIVDRGPASPRVLKFFQSQPNTRSLQGNHERKYIRSYRSELNPALSQRITRQQFGEAYPAGVAFMQTFPLFLELPEAVLVHGYWEPGVPQASQRETVLAGTMGGDRYLSEHYAGPWYEYYDGELPLIVGHQDYLRNRQPLIYRERVFGLDTGCHDGGALTGLLLPEFRIISIPSRANYWRELRAQYRQVRPSPPPPVVWSEADDALLGELHTAISRRYEQIWAQLKEEPGFMEWSPRQQDKVYAERVGDRPLARFLHLARQGNLTLEWLRREVRRPERLMNFALQIEDDGSVPCVAGPT